LTVKLVAAIEREFKNKAGDLVRGWSLTFLDQSTGETSKYFVGNDNLKGFDPKQLAKITGKDLEISTNVKTFDGKSRVVLDKVVELL